MLNPDDTDTFSARRHAILIAAAEAFLSHGYTATTTAQIARLAKTSKRAIYQHFPSKHEMLAAMVRERSREMVLAVEMGAPASEPEFYATLVEFGAHFLARLVDPSTIELYRLAIGEAGGDNDLGQALEASGRAPVVAAVTRFVTLGVSRGWLVADGLPEAVETYFDALTGWLPIYQLLRTAPLPDEAELRLRSERVAKVLRMLAGARMP